jgi:hypothetical protein
VGFSADTVLVTLALRLAASVQNHFHQDRHLNRRTIFKQKRAVALAEWRHLAA